MIFTLLTLLIIWTFYLGYDVVYYKINNNYHSNPILNIIFTILYCLEILYLNTGFYQDVNILVGCLLPICLFLDGLKLKTK